MEAFHDKRLFCTNNITTKVKLAVALKLSNKLICYVNNKT